MWLSARSGRPSIESPVHIVRGVNKRINVFQSQPKNDQDAGLQAKVPTTALHSINLKLML